MSSNLLYPAFSIDEAVNVQSARCLSCGGDKFETLFNLSTYPVKQCINCKLQFLHPQPSDEALTQIYSQNYFLESEVGSDMQVALKGATARLYLQQIQKAKAFKPGQTLLEIGCGTGDFLVEAKNAGYDVFGLEYSSVAAGAANAKLGESAVHVGSADTVELPENGYDVIVGCDVIEHVRDPHKFVSNVLSALKPDGIFYCVTPSTDSLSAKLMGNNWVEYKEEHLYYFNTHNLSNLFLNAGFSAAAVRKNYKVLNLTYIIAHFERFPKPFWTMGAVAAKNILPKGLRDKPFHVVASGLAMLARK